MPRLTVINPDIIAHCIKHPARGEPWSLRTLAKFTGTSPSTLRNLATGTCPTVKAELAANLAQAFGVALPVLFRTGVSADSHTTRDVT